MSYFFIYIVWFFILEHKVTTNFNSVHLRLDDYIPFNEWFVIPYCLWFAYIFATVGYFFFTSRSDFYRCAAYLFIGMTVCLIIYTIWPNGQTLRPDLTKLGRHNLLIDLVANFYKADTPTNVCPSIHVFNSIGAFLAIHRSEALKKHKGVQAGAFILTVLICLSTMFIKQHSAFDVMAGIALSFIMYLLVYVPNYSKQEVKEKKLFARQS